MSLSPHNTQQKGQTGQEHDGRTNEAHEQEVKKAEGHAEHKERNPDQDVSEK